MAKFTDGSGISRLWDRIQTLITNMMPDVSNKMNIDGSNADDVVTFDGSLAVGHDGENSTQAGYKIPEYTISEISSELVSPPVSPLLDYDTRIAAVCKNSLNHDSIFIFKDKYICIYDMVDESWSIEEFPLYGSIQYYTGQYTRVIAINDYIYVLGMRTDNTDLVDKFIRLDSKTLERVMLDPFPQRVSDIKNHTFSNLIFDPYAVKIRIISNNTLWTYDFDDDEWLGPSIYSIDGLDHSPSYSSVTNDTMSLVQVDEDIFYRLRGVSRSSEYVALDLIIKRDSKYYYIQLLNPFKTTDKPSGNQLMPINMRILFNMNNKPHYLTNYMLSVIEGKNVLTMYYSSDLSAGIPAYYYDSLPVFDNKLYYLDEDNKIYCLEETGFREGYDVNWSTALQKKIHNCLNIGENLRNYAKNTINIGTDLASINNNQISLGGVQNKYDSPVYKSRYTVFYYSSIPMSKSSKSNVLNIQSPQIEHVDNDYADADCPSSEIFSLDELGNLFLNGAIYKARGQLNGITLGTTASAVNNPSGITGREIDLEPGAMYLLFITGRVMSTGAFRGMHAYVIDNTWNTLGTGATTSALAIPHIASIGSTGTAACRLTAISRGSVGTGGFYGSLGIGTCTTAIAIRYTLVKVSGSTDDFPAS